MVFFLGGVVLCCSVGVGICVTDAIGVYTVCCAFLKTVMVVAWCERIPRRRCCVMLRYWFMCTVRSPLKKVVEAWCECVPRRCYVMLRLYVGICVTVSIVVYAVLHSWRRWWQPSVSAFLGGVSLNNPSACDATNTHSTHTHTTVQAFPFHHDHSPCGHCKCKINDDDKVDHGWQW